MLYLGGGSCLAINGVISRVAILTAQIWGLITSLITTYEPPSSYSQRHRPVRLETLGDNTGDALNSCNSLAKSEFYTLKSSFAARALSFKHRTCSDIACAPLRDDARLQYFSAAPCSSNGLQD